MKELHKRVIEAAVEFRICYANPELETDRDLIEAVDELLEQERKWNPAGVRDHVEFDHA